MALTPTLAPGALEALEAFVRDHVEDAGASGVVLGFSGGVDSALAAVLCARALGPRRVSALYLPIEAFNRRDLDDARQVAKQFRFPLREQDLTEAFRAMEAATSPRGRVARGNLKARVRMLALYAEANSRGALVVGTGNKSELLTGYFTKWGDGGCDLLPIGDLYKTQVRALARELKIPKRVIEKPPSAGLWPGQTDEGDLGISYARLDQILLGLELKMNDADIVRRTGLPLAAVRKVRARVEASSHKRRMPPVCKLGLRTVGIDWREL
jgi:NAD+ synthase